MKTGFEATAARSPRSEDAPTMVPMRASAKPADRRKPSTDEVKSRRLKKIKSSYTTPGYYVITADGSPVEGPFETYSLAIAKLNGRDGIEYFGAAPGAKMIQPFPPQLQQVNGSKHMSSDWDDAFAFTAADDDSDDDDKKNKDDDKGSKPPWMTDDDDDSDDSDDSDSDDDSDDDDDDDSDKDSDSDDKDSDKSNKSNLPWEKDSYLLPIQVREARLLKAIASAPPRDAQRLMAELEGIRMTESLRLQADREIMFVDEFVNSTLTPVVSYQHHTAATDWISEAADTTEAPAEIESAMLTAAASWWNRTVAAVKEDRDECFAQASGIAARTASQVPEYRDMAYDAFMGHVGFLRARSVTAGAAGDMGPDPWNEEHMELPATQVLGDDFNGQDQESPRTWDDGGEWDNGEAAYMMQANRRTASEAFDEQHQSYDEALSRMSEQGKQTAMSADAFPGSMAAAGPSETQTAIMATLKRRHGAVHPDFAKGFLHGHMDGSAGSEYGANTEGMFIPGHGWSGNQVPHHYVQGYGEGYGVGSAHAQEHAASMKRSAKPDLANNPTAEYNPAQAHEQSGEAQSGLPLAPGDHVEEHMDFLTEFPDTGPGLVPSTRAPVIQENAQGKTSSLVLARAKRLAPYIPKYAASSTPAAIESDIRRRAAIKGVGPMETEMYVEAALTLHAEVKPDGTPAVDPWLQEERRSNAFGPVPVGGYADTDHGQMYPWTLGDGNQGAADVADVPAPGVETGVGWPQPDNARRESFKTRVRANIGGVS